ncbi:hypothetical protein [Vibrio scophthalmi]|uniref:Helix-turn-helix domain-containing protein n=1 Tax=Vibrio scophthalmi TaxID=45658 RepID=A0A1E3WIW1_9VIBR|nr:hypothetical protein [Vibrio scophthalmi]ODS09719.1 hypothetical protein VSF3289_03240 [Vibrio scophthalmi]
MNKTKPEHFLCTISELSKMLGFDRRTIETRLYTNRVTRHTENNGVPLYVVRDAVEAVYRTQFMNQGAACLSRNTN